MRSVVMEEMLHMVHAANVLNAIGGAPSLDHPGFIPKYPLILPVLNMSADLVWFTRESIEHYQVLESTPPGGYNQSISAAYLHVVALLTALCDTHGEPAIFSGNRSLQVDSSTSGQEAAKVFSLAQATVALLGVADQGGGCAVPGQPWPETVNISAGPLGGAVSHAARYQELLAGRSYQPNDTVGHETGAAQSVDWSDVLRFSPNPTVSDFLPEQCVAGGSWVVRNASFFVKAVWEQHGHHLAESTEARWEDCAGKCANWTISKNLPLAPCAMWSWNSDGTTERGGVAPHACLLAQGGGPVTTKEASFQSGCQFGTVCNQSLPHHGAPPATAAPTPALLEACRKVHVRHVEFAANYTALLVQLHNVFNGNPTGLGPTIGAMMTLKELAVGLMKTRDPRIVPGTLGVGPPWEYVPAASEYEKRGRRARPGPPVAVLV